MKRALIVVDYQYDFVVGKLGFSDALNIENNIELLIKNFRNCNNDIIFTFDTHYENYMSTSEGKFLPIPHCILNTEGHDLFGKIKALKKEEDVCFNKLTFGSIDLANYLKSKEYDEVVLCGVVTNICVISNAILAKSALPEAEISVVKRACASNDLEMQDLAYRIMKGLNIKVIE